MYELRNWFLREVEEGRETAMEMPDFGQGSTFIPLR